MTRISFADIRFFDQAHTSNALEARFLRFLRELRMQKWDQIKGPNDLSAEDHDRLGKNNLLSSVFIQNSDLVRVARRSAAILAARKKLSKLAHLKSNDIAALRPLNGGSRLVPPPTEHQADEIAASLHAEMPWAAEATTAIWHDLRSLAREGAAAVRLAPLLLDGGPGIGKTTWARRLAQHLRMPTIDLDAATESANFSLVGSQRGWSNARPGRLIEAVIQTGSASQLVIIDEIEKAGRVQSTTGQVFSLENALLSLLEPVTAPRWTCPYYEIKCDMSWLCWVLTGNNADLLHDALRSRCRLIRMRDPSPEELVAFVDREGARRRLSDTARGAAEDTILALVQRSARVDLRDVRRVLERAEALQHLPTLH